MADPLQRPKGQVASNPKGQINFGIKCDSMHDKIPLLACENVNIITDVELLNSFDLVPLHASTSFQAKDCETET